MVQHQQQATLRKASLTPPPQPPKRRRAAPPTTTTAPPPQKPRQSKLAKEHNITSAQELEISEAFSLFSTQPSSTSTSSKAKAPPLIPTASIRRALTALGAPPTSPSELRDLIEAADPEETGFAGYEEFVGIAALKVLSKGSGDDGRREEVEEAFGLFVGGRGKGKGVDDGGGGGGGGEKRISLAMLKRVARELKEDVGEQVLKDMILEANGGEGVGRGVGLGEFEGVMRRAGVFR
ncbi:hypothetical protein MMC14_000358 [Varicellaria rhodocarpa]|nr:hypothetical protein [Varicellaria rhodocarpa]